MNFIAVIKGKIKRTGKPSRGLFHDLEDAIEWAEDRAHVTRNPVRIFSRPMMKLIHEEKPKK